MRKNMIKKILIVCSFLFLSACAKQYDNVLNIVEYDASGKYNPFIETSLGGVSVSNKGSLPDGTSIEYRSSTSKIKVMIENISNPSIYPLDSTDLPNTTKINKNE